VTQQKDTSSPLLGIMTTLKPKPKYDFAAKVIEKEESEPKSVQEFLCAQTIFVNTLTTHAEINDAVQHAVEHLIITQAGMKNGINLWGKGVDSILKEMNQFHDRDAVRPLLPTEITENVKAKALGYLMFLRKKRNGEIKGRGCADGRPQQLYKSKEETYSQTASTESIFITALIDAQEGRDVAIVDIPGAFLQTMASDNNIIKL